MRWWRIAGTATLTVRGDDTVAVVTFKPAMRQEVEQGYCASVRPMLVLRPSETWCQALQLTGADPDHDPNVVGLVAGLLPDPTVDLAPLRKVRR